MVLTDKRLQIRARTTSLTFSQILHLSKDQLNSILRSYPKETRLVRKFACKLALRRGAVLVGTGGKITGVHHVFRLQAHSHRGGLDDLIQLFECAEIRRQEKAVRKAGGSSLHSCQSSLADPSQLELAEQPTGATGMNSSSEEEPVIESPPPESLPGSLPSNSFDSSGLDFVVATAPQAVTEPQFNRLQRRLTQELQKMESRLVEQLAAAQKKA
jgi:hypothetical protein